MWNLTTRLAVAIKNVPADVDWSNNTPQGSRKLLTAEDILPDATDAMIFRKRALLYLQHFLVSEFDHLGKLRPFLPEMHPSTPVNKSQVVPMKILFRDEKYAAENVAILMELVQDAKLTGNDEVP